MSTAKSYYSAAELAELRLPGLPASERNIRARAECEGWQSVALPSCGTTGTRREYVVASLPAEARTALVQHTAAAVAAQLPEPATMHAPLPARLPQSAADLTEADRAQGRAARMAQTIDRLEAVAPVDLATVGGGDFGCTEDPPGGGSVTKPVESVLVTKAAGEQLSLSPI